MPGILLAPQRAFSRYFLNEEMSPRMAFLPPWLRKNHKNSVWTDVGVQVHMPWADGMRTWLRV